MSNYERLVEEHNSPNRDLNKVAKYFTLCNMEGVNLKAFNFLNNKKPDLRWSSGKEY